MDDGKNDPAFPFIVDNKCAYSGLTKREYIAIKLYAAILANGSLTQPNSDAYYAIKCTDIFMNLLSTVKPEVK